MLNCEALFRPALSALCAVFAFCSASAFAAMPDAEFLALCEKGTVEQVKQALAEGANPNARETKDAGWTALMRAVNRKDAPLVRTLLSAGADVNAASRAPANFEPEGDDPDPSGWTPLMVAATNDDLPLVQVLLAAGAKVNARNGDGETALMWAADKSEALAQALLAADAEVNAQNGDLETALIRAAMNGEAGTVAALLAAGADRSVSGRGNTALGWAEHRLKHAGSPREKAEAERIIRLLQGGAKKPAAQDAGAFSAADLKRMSTFVSNFVEVRLPDFDLKDSGGDPSNPMLIYFGVVHNAINNNESRIKPCAGTDCTHGAVSIDAKFVAESVKKYFDLGVQHRSVPRTDDGFPCHFDGTRYHFDIGDIGDLQVAKVTRAVREGGVIRMTGDIYSDDYSDDPPYASFTATAKPHKWNGKDAWAILSLKTKRR